MATHVILPIKVDQKVELAVPEKTKIREEDGRLIYKLKSDVIAVVDYAGLLLIYDPAKVGIKLMGQQEEVSPAPPPPQQPSSPPPATQQPVTSTRPGR